MDIPRYYQLDEVGELSSFVLSGANYYTESLKIPKTPYKKTCGISNVGAFGLIDIENDDFPKGISDRPSRFFNGRNPYMKYTTEYKSNAITYPFSGKKLFGWNWGVWISGGTSWLEGN